MNKTIMITGANAGIGKETARQLALEANTEKVFLACRNKAKAEAAKQSLIASTGRDIFQISIMDVSDLSSVQRAVAQLEEPIDALIMNAGGMGGKSPERITKDGVTYITAVNLLGHVHLVDELLKAKKLKKVALFASSEAARGIPKMGMHRPRLKSSSIDDFAAILDGSAYEDKFDPMQVYGTVKYTGTMWMGSMARKNPDIKFITMSPGGTRGTEGFNDMPVLQRLFFKYIGMPILMPLMGMSHSLETGARRFVDGIKNEALSSGRFYASKENVLTGKVIDQSTIFPDLENEAYQDNAFAAVHRFMPSPVNSTAIS